MSLLTTVDRRGADAGVAHALQVTPDNFARAESDMQFMTVVKRGGFGRLTHERDFPPAGRQSAPWADGDVLRSRAIFDLELGPVTVTIPPTGERFVSLEALDEDHYTVAMFYGPGSYSFSFDNVSTRYVLIVARIMVDPANRADLSRVHELQEAITVSRHGRWPLRDPELGSGEPGQGARGVAVARQHGERRRPHVRRARGSGPGASPDRHRHAVGPLPAARHRLSTRRASQE